MPAPTAPTNNIFPDWTNLVDTWRDTDAEWLRNRSVQIFADITTRTAAMGTPPSFGMMSIVQAGPPSYAAIPAPTTSSLTGGPDFWNGTAWESVRYPNLNVASDSTTVTLKRQGAGTGLQLISDSSVNIATLVAGTGTKASYVGSLLDATGISIKVGGDTAKLATDNNGLTVDSPVAVTGGISATGTITAPTVTATTTLNAGTIVATGPASAASYSAPTVTGTTSVSGGDAMLATSGIYGIVKHRTTGSAQISLGSDSTVTIAGTGGVTVTPATTFTGAITANAAATFKIPPVVSQAGKDANIQEAMIIMVSGNVAPTSNPPDGTLYITY